MKFVGFLCARVTLLKNMRHALNIHVHIGNKFAKLQHVFSNETCSLSLGENHIVEEHAALLEHTGNVELL